MNLLQKKRIFFYAEQLCFKEYSKMINSKIINCEELADPKIQQQMRIQEFFLILNLDFNC